MTRRELNQANPLVNREKVRSAMDQLAASNGSVYPIAEPAVGDLVEVSTRFTGSWSRGFVVVGVQHHAYHLRRLSDGHVLPITFSAHELRADRRRGPVAPAGAA